MQDATTKTFRVLIVDDIPESGTLIADDLHAEIRGEGVSCLLASSFDEARDLVDSRCIDAVLTDYNLGRADPSGGLRFLEHLKAVDAKLDAAIYTRHYSDARFTDAALQTTTLLSASKVRVVAAVNIGDSTEPLVEAVRFSQRTWLDRRIDLRDELGIGRLLREARIAKWLSDEEADAEALRVLSSIYGNAGLGSDPIHFRIRVPGEDAYDLAEASVDTGHSGAVVIYPELDLDLAPEETRETTGRAVRTVLKLGQPPALQDERDRFRNVVSFGVPLRGRVEFLGFSRRRSLAGLCYGFAGGVFGEQVVSMKRDLLSPGGVARAQSSVRELFSKESKSWYRHTFEEKISQTSYVVKSNRRPLDDMFGRFLDKLAALPWGDGCLISKRTRQEDGGIIRMTVGSAKLEFPPRDFAGSELLRKRRSQTLVHGDMHAGNVLLELLARSGGLHKQRTVLIDFAEAGRGPRSEDLATLYASLAQQLACLRSKYTEFDAANWLSGEFRRDRVRFTDAFRLKERSDVAAANRLISPEHIGISSPEPDGDDALLLEVLVALGINFESLEYGELAASLMVRAIELSLHEADDVAFLRLAGLVAVTRALLSTSLPE